MAKIKVDVKMLDDIADNWDALDNDLRGQLIHDHPSLYFAVARLARWWQVSRWP